VAQVLALAGNLSPDPDRTHRRADALTVPAVGQMGKMVMALRAATPVVDVQRGVLLTLVGLLQTVDMVLPHALGRRHLRLPTAPVALVAVAMHLDVWRLLHGIVGLGRIWVWLPARVCSPTSALRASKLLTLAALRLLDVLLGVGHPAEPQMDLRRIYRGQVGSTMRASGRRQRDGTVAVRTHRQRCLELAPVRGRRLVPFVVLVASQGVPFRIRKEMMPVIDPIADTLHIIEQRLAVMADPHHVTLHQMRAIRRMVFPLETPSLCSVNSPVHLIESVVPEVIVIGVVIAVFVAMLVMNMHSREVRVGVLGFAAMVEVVNTHALFGKAGHSILRTLVLGPMPEAKVDRALIGTGGPD
jgi:hypothetical protein